LAKRSKKSKSTKPPERPIALTHVPLAPLTLREATQALGFRPGAIERLQSLGWLDRTLVKVDGRECYTSYVLPLVAVAEDLLQAATDRRITRDESYNGTWAMQAPTFAAWDNVLRGREHIAPLSFAHGRGVLMLPSLRRAILALQQITQERHRRLRNK
jgi:hypothetical protein